MDISTDDADLTEEDEEFTRALALSLGGEDSPPASVKDEGFDADYQVALELDRLLNQNQNQGPSSTQTTQHKHQKNTSPTHHNHPTTSTTKKPTNSSSSSYKKKSKDEEDPQLFHFNQLQQKDQYLYHFNWLEKYPNVANRGAVKITDIVQVFYRIIIILYNEVLIARPLYNNDDE